MEVKLFEICDKATFIPAMAVKLTARDDHEMYLLRRAGYGKEQIAGITTGTQLRCVICGYMIGAGLAEELLAKNSGGVECPNHRDNPWYMKPESGTKDYDGEPYVMLWRLEGGPAEYDPYAWSNRTMATAHQHIVDFWQRLESGDVVDVQYILGETKEAKKSERTL